MEVLELQVFLGTQDNVVPKVILVIPVPWEQQAPSAPLDRLALLDLKAMRVRPVHRVFQDPEEIVDFLDQLVPLDLQVLQDHQEIMVNTT